MRKSWAHPSSSRKETGGQQAGFPARGFPARGQVLAWAFKGLTMGPHQPGHPQILTREWGLLPQEAELIRNIQELLKRTIMQAVNQIRWVSVVPHPPLSPHPLGWLWAGSWGEQVGVSERWGLVPGLSQEYRTGRGNWWGCRLLHGLGAWASRTQVSFPGQGAGAPGRCWPGRAWVA